MRCHCIQCQRRYGPSGRTVSRVTHASHMKKELERYRDPTQTPTYPVISGTSVISNPVQAPTYQATSEQQTESEFMEIEEVEEVEEVEEAEEVEEVEEAEEIEEVEEIEHSEENLEQPEENLEKDYDLDVYDIPQDSEQYQQPEGNLEQGFYDYDYNLDVDDIPPEILDDKPDNPPDSDLNIPEQLDDASDFGSILILASCFFQHIKFLIPFLYRII
jgi:hypothetical protein